MGGLDQSECLVGIRYTQVQLERVPHAIPGRAGGALSLQLSVVSGAPAESLRDVSLRRRVHRIARALKSEKESGRTFGSCCRTGAAMVD